MVIAFRNVCRNAAWLCLVVFLVACTPDRPIAEDLSNMNLPTNTSPAQPTEPAVPPRKPGLTRIPPFPAGQADNGGTADSGTPAPVIQNKALQAALDRLSESLDLSIDQIEVVSVTHVEWRTECMGISSSGSVCAQVITPGWVIVLQAEDREYTFHTDETGNRVRQK